MSDKIQNFDENILKIESTSKIFKIIITVGQVLLTHAPYSARLPLSLFGSVGAKLFPPEPKVNDLSNVSNTGTM